MRGLALAGMGLALNLGLAVGSAHAANCQEILGNGLYRCQLTSEVGGSGEMCLQFATPGTESPKFDVVAPGNARYGCTCKAKGKVAAPSFDASKEFLCVNPVSNTVAEALEGKVSGSGKAIKGGLRTTANGQVFVFTCELDPACS